jgi:SnoaL-like polyketide cyclase
VLRVRARGADSGTGQFGHLPTGKPISIHMIDVARFADGRMIEHWGVPDRMSILQQLGHQAYLAESSSRSRWVNESVARRLACVVGNTVVCRPYVWVHSTESRRTGGPDERPPHLTSGADITDNDHNPAVAGGLFSDIPAHDPTQRTAVDDSPAAMRLLRAPFAVPLPDASSAADPQPDHQR